MYKCLIIEDDLSIKNLLNNILKKQYIVFQASSGYEAINLFSTKKPDFIFLDLGLPDMDGTEVLKIIRSWSNTPILVVTARSMDKDKVSSLDLGADDYITKPFSIDEFLARIRVIIRRIDTTIEENPIFKNKDLEINYLSHTVKIKDNEIHLTPLEYKLLVLLSKNIGKVLSYSTIINELWNTKSIDEYILATLRVFMAGLRKKIEDDPSSPKYILTVLSTGYRMIY